jgi:hypothetical protein
MSGPSRKVAVVVWGAMLAAPALFAAMTLAVAAPNELRSPELAGLFFWMAGAMVGLGVALSRLLPLRILPRDPGPRDTLAFTRLLAAWAILEGAAMFPLVAELVTGDPLLYLLCGVAVAAQISLFPSAERWAAYAVQPLPSGGSGRMAR